ncbi:MAG: cytochrome c oxidase subunit II [Chloroflexi bacterium]|nr:cytochrome c oxidase subunit II [Chloroflexota bacterium]
MRKHWVIPTALTVVISVLVILLFLNTSFLPLNASDQGRPVDTLFRVMFALGGIIFVLVMVILLYSVLAFRRRPGDMEDGPPLEGHAGLETVWTLVPLAIVVILAVYGGIVLKDIIGPPPGEELVVRVDSFQWGWRFEYPQHGVISPVLRLPVDRPVLLELTSRDVVHSFWVPEFRVKQDAVPGMTTHLRITPTLIGEYRLYCAELCGLAHWAMQAPVSVLDQADFQRWVAEQRR